MLLLEVDAQRRAIARSVGLEVLDPASADVAGHVAAWTEGAGAGVSFEVSGAQAGLDAAVEHLAVRGRLVLVAIHAQPKPVNLQRIFWRELTILGARVYERADYERAVELVAAGVVPVDALVTAVVPLRQAAEAFELLEGGAGAMKVLVDCRAEAGAEAGAGT